MFFLTQVGAGPGPCLALPAWPACLPACLEFICPALSHTPEPTRNPNHRCCVVLPTHPSSPPLQRLVHTGLAPAMYRYQALAKALKRQVAGEDDDDDAPLEGSA